jgi:long-subunit acyl-CoA synthetase (AMP-forming)
LIAMPLNAALKRPEVAGLLALTEPRVFVADEHAGLARAAGEDVAHVPAVVEPASLERSGAGAPEASMRPEDVAVLIATSGTTGAPKAVAQTHRAFALTAEARRRCSPGSPQTARRGCPPGSAGSARPAA